MSAQNQLFQETIAPYSLPVQKTLRALRQLVLKTAMQHEDIGPITQELRWGQFSFLTLETRSGTTIRIDGKRAEAHKAAMYFHCQSGLINHFKELYGDQLTYEGKRALVFDARASLAEDIIRHCILLALAHHLRKIPAKIGN